MPFFDFIYNTFQERVNLPTVQGKPNPYYLPEILTNIEDPGHPGKKLLPLLAAEWKIGTIGGTEGGVIASSIATWYTTHLIKDEKLSPATTFSIPDPAAPNPALDLSQVQVNGLNNLVALPAPAVMSGSTGYSITVSLGFNQIQALPPLSISGQFMLQQSVCRGLEQNSGNNVCDGYSDTIPGEGTFEACFSHDAVVDAQVSIGISGAGAARSVALQITKLTLRGQTLATPSFTVQVQITNTPKEYEGDNWTNLANEAFDSPDAKTALILSMNQTLNTADNLNSLGATLLGQLNDGLTNIFGPVPGGGLPDDAGQAVGNPVDLYMVDRIRAALNDSGSSYYLPTLLLQSSSPRLEPFTVDSLDLGSQKVGGLAWQPNILSNLAISGLSNNIAPAAQMLLTEPNLSLTTTQGALLPPPPGIPAPPLTITGDFSFTLPQMGAAVTGSFRITVATSNLRITATASGDRIESLQISLLQLALLVAPAQLAIELTFSPGSSSLAGFASSLEQSASIKATIIDQINTKLADASLLSSISGQLTDTAKNTIIDQMGGPIPTT